MLLCSSLKVSVRGVKTFACAADAGVKPSRCAFPEMRAPSTGCSRHSVHRTTDEGETLFEDLGLGPIMQLIDATFS